MTTLNTADDLLAAALANHNDLCELAEALTEHCARMTPTTARDAATALADLPPELKHALQAGLNAARERRE